MRALGTIIGAYGRRVRRAVQRHGVLGIFPVAAEYAVRLAASFRPSVRADIRDRKAREIAFDEQFGVDTAGHIHQAELEIDNPNKFHAVAYGGSDPKYFKEVIATLPIDYSCFVFIDFGSGKGRAILLATEFPFKKIVGVEFSEELHQIAQDNIRRFNCNFANCTYVESICMDVLDYELPDEPLICYFCNPFDATLMGLMLRRICDSLLRTPRELFVVYYNPRAGDLLDNSDRFSRVGTCGPIRIWRVAHLPAE